MVVAIDFLDGVVAVVVVVIFAVTIAFTVVVVGAVIVAAATVVAVVIDDVDLKRCIEFDCEFDRPLAERFELRLLGDNLLIAPVLAGTGTIGGSIVEVKLFCLGGEQPK